jgi:hypothetical protein
VEQLASTLGRGGVVRPPASSGAIGPRLRCFSLSPSQINARLPSEIADRRAESVNNLAIAGRRRPSTVAMGIGIDLGENYVTA